MEINKTYLGDCLELMKNIKTGSIGMILCDLPYNTTDCSWDKQPICLDSLKKEYYRIIKQNGTIVLTAQKKFTFLLGITFLDSYRYKWTWHKDKCAGFQLCNSQPLQNSEDILVFNKVGFKRSWNDTNSHKKGLYNPQMRKGAGGSRDKVLGKLLKKSNTGHLDAINNRKSIKSTHKIASNDSSKQRYPIDIIYFNVPYGKDRFHPTQKPVALMEYLIKTYTNEGDLVLDNCAGSGTTGIACLNLKRNYIMMEQEKEYFDIINNRVNNWHKERAERLF